MYNFYKVSFRKEDADAVAAAKTNAKEEEKEEQDKKREGEILWRKKMSDTKEHLSESERETDKYSFRFVAPCNIDTKRQIQRCCMKKRSRVYKRKKRTKKISFIYSHRKQN